MLHSVFIRNMFSKRCIVLVSGIFRESGLVPVVVEIGKVRLEGKPTAEKLARVSAKLECSGFAINTAPRAALTFAIKELLLKLLEPDAVSQKRKSIFLSQKLKCDYYYLSSVFTEVEGQSIEKYFIGLKVARIRKLIETADIRFVDLAYQFGYSSPAHLSTQFKKEVGLTPTQYRNRFAKKKHK